MRRHQSSFLIATLALLTLCACNDEEGGIALGTLERDRVALTATAAEVVVDLPVEEGTQVEKGDVLVRLNDTGQRAELAYAEAELAKATASLEKLRNGARKEELATAQAAVSGAEAALLETEQNFERIKDLRSRGTASDAAYDAAVANRDAAEASLASAREQLLQLKNGARPEDLAIAEAELAAASARVESARKLVSDLTVEASRDGFLDSLPWNLGERVTVGSPVAILLALEAPFARVYVPEPYRVKINKGDVLSVRVDGLDDSIEGTVRWISSEPAFTPYYALNQEQRARLMYLAEVALPDDANALPSGVPAQVILP
ncbi:MAG: HlyD family efflux transporter periplasmic adaptor subunit [Rhodobacteraceae bacterium]|nr:HlyD family efflux transporter periplasmic adaptor subunit [Paracoccaceae bacterium]